MVHYTWATSPKTVKAEVQTLQTELQRLLGDNLLGLYLYGSLAQGGFQPARSDLDVLAVTTQKIDLSIKRSILELLLRISRTPNPIDIYFLVKSDLFPFQQPLPFDLHYNERLRDTYQDALRNNSLQNDLNQHDPNLAIDLTILHKFGIPLAGKPISETLPSVPEPTFRATLIAATRTASKERLQDLISFVLNACRTLAYLREGTLLSKDAAGSWGETHLPEKYYPLLHQSLALYRTERLSRPAGRALLDDFATFIDEALQ
jgi:predicted nucleotidyltransferase